MKKKSEMIWTIILVLIVLSCLLASFITSQNPYEVNLAKVLQKPSFYNVMGTDAMGRDVFARILYGGRVSLSIGLFSMIISTIIGILYGGISGYFGGGIDSFMMRILDTLLAIPTIIVVLAFQSIVRGGVLSIILVIGGTSWLSTARIVRSQFIELKDKNFIKSAIIMGTPVYKILTKHLLRNSIPAILVISILNSAQSIFMEVSMSFLGIGVPQGTPSWGNMLNNAQSDILSGCWWIALFPGLAIIISLLCINFIGEYCKNFATQSF